MSTIQKIGIGVAAAGLLSGLAGDMALAQGGAGPGAAGGPGSGQPGDRQTAKATPQASERPASSREVIGKVQTIDAKEHTLRVEGHGGALTLDPSTEVVKDGSRASMDDVREGDRVRASFSGSDRSRVQRLEVTSRAKGTDTSTGSNFRSEMRDRMHGAKDANSAYPTPSSGATSGSDATAK